jgi:UMF1 family MFS transporter
VSSPTTDAPAPAGSPAPQSTRRERVGWYFYDWANSAFSTTVIAVFLSPYLTNIAERAAGCTGDDCTDATVYPLGIPVAAGSFYSYVLSLSVLLQVIVLPVTGALTDRTRHRRKLLALFAYIGAFATIGFFFLSGGNYLLGGGLFLVANVAFGASIVVYNSFLPSLASPDDRDRVSSLGWGMGYVGGGLLLLVNLAAYTFGPEGSTELIVRISLASAGVWWAIFTTMPLLMLKDPEPHNIVRAEGSALTGGFKQLFQTLKGMRAYPLTLFFLIAFLIYNDGVQTVIGVSSQYASEYLLLSDETRIITILIVQFTAFGGALLLGRIARTFGAWKTVLASLVLWAVVVGAAYFLPVGKAGPFMVLGVALGIVLGGTQALSRSLFSQMIPDGKEGEYFGFYEISDKGTSWLGPLVFGLSFQFTKDYQIAIVSIVGFFVIGFLALLVIPIRKAIIAAGNTPPRVL